ncbi:carbon-nitrogen hydrolase family protein [Cohnella sp. JJ-181]|uniref:carbon-nitrogen hydrolase family protein n=1 Tax=Cohnella rhizoplanae TaxID=2974897 RepID=UPI0022FF66E2|nr:carbon-nitrogen hydrolase family protein [Cohnella sp. JJ-181]CAI6037826.1 Nitrilase [Cohnella sp. JJ-181]
MNSLSVRVAVVQAAPRLFDRNSALERIAGSLREAAALGARLVVFPETFVSGYPRGLGFGAKIGSRSQEGRQLWQRHWESAIELPGAETLLIGQAVREAGVYAVIGVVERAAEFSRSTLYNTIAYFGPDGSLLGKHRKLMPTGAERLLWGQGDGSTLTVVDTPFGRIGGLICWENYMPLARMAMYAKGVDILVTPTADARDTWQSTLRHIACEGRCFVLSANQYATAEDYPDDLPGETGPASGEDVCRGGSAIVGPLGDYLAPPLYGESGILYADLDLGEIARSRFDFDAAGHYNRPDIFRLEVDERPKAAVRFTPASGAHLSERQENPE